MKAESGTESAQVKSLPHEFEGLDPQAQKIARRCLTILATLGSASLIGVASSAYIINHYPLLLIFLSPIGRHLLLVAPTVNPLNETMSCPETEAIASPNGLGEVPTSGASTRATSVPAPETGSIS